MSRNQTETDGFSRRKKVAISILLLLHLAAVFIAPFSFATQAGRETSPASSLVMGNLQPYVDMMYLNHGYFFFAPEPGPSHLMRYKVDGEIVADFPDRKEQWPRLLYHRHFMLSEWIHGAALQADANYEPTEASPAVRNYRALEAAFINHMKTKTDGSEIELVRVEHAIPGPFDLLREDIDLRDRRLLVELPGVGRAAIPRQALEDVNWSNRTE